MLNISTNPDETRYDPSYLGEECRSQAKILLNQLDIHYPQGFICSNWLEEEGYRSKSKCSCYRGRPLEVITFWRSSNSIIRINDHVTYRNKSIEQ